MAITLSHVTVDSVDAYALSCWWRAQLGYQDRPGAPNAPGDDECWIESPQNTHALLFIAVPEHKAIKNRLHFDVRPSDRTRDAEVLRLLSAGASWGSDHRSEDGRGWVTLLDPEGNEFCVLRSEAEIQELPTR